LLEEPFFGLSTFEGELVGVLLMSLRGDETSLGDAVISVHSSAVLNTCLVFLGKVFLGENNFIVVCTDCYLLFSVLFSNNF